MQKTSSVNLCRISKWGEANDLYPIMEKMVFPQIRHLPFNDLLFFSFLAGINCLIEAQEKTTTPTQEAGEKR